MLCATLTLLTPLLATLAILQLKEMERDSSELADALSARSSGLERKLEKAQEEVARLRAEAVAAKDEATAKAKKTEAFSKVRVADSVFSASEPACFALQQELDSSRRYYMWTPCQPVRHL